MLVAVVANAPAGVGNAFLLDVAVGLEEGVPAIDAIRDALRYDVEDVAVAEGLDVELLEVVRALYGAAGVLADEYG